MRLRSISWVTAPRVSFSGTVQTPGSSESSAKIGAGGKPSSFFMPSTSISDTAPNPRSRAMSRTARYQRTAFSSTTGSAGFRKSHSRFTCAMTASTSAFAARSPRWTISSISKNSTSTPMRERSDTPSNIVP